MAEWIDGKYVCGKYIRGSNKTKKCMKPPVEGRPVCRLHGAMAGRVSKFRPPDYKNAAARQAEKEAKRAEQQQKSEDSQ